MNKGKVIAVAVVVVCAVAASFIFVLRGSAQASDYDEAVRLADAGETQAAYDKFASLGDYGDAQERALELVSRDPALPYRAAAKGSLVTFGSWEQDGNAENGTEPISWIVLDKVDGRLLLLSEACLAARPYNPVEFEAVTWETCELRSWLNGAFLAEAFDASERSLISQVENANDDRIGAPDEDAEMYGTIEASEEGEALLSQGGAETLDYVFLLSETDTLIYLHDEMSREANGKALLSAAVAAEGQARLYGDGYVGWWLRSPGVYAFSAQFVTEEGEPHTAGAYAELVYGVRPAIWLDVSEDAAGGTA